MIICFLRTSELYYFFFIHIIINILSTAVGIEWILDNDASSAAVLVASEAHAITLAIEGLLGVVFTVATLTDEAVDVGEVIDAGFSSAIPFWCLANIIFFLLFACLSLVFILSFPFYKSPAWIPQIRASSFVGVYWENLKSMYLNGRFIVVDYTWRIFSYFIKV